MSELYYCKHCKITYYSATEYIIHGNRIRYRSCYWKEKDKKRELKLLEEQQKMFADAKKRYLEYLESMK